MKHLVRESVWRRGHLDREERSTGDLLLYTCTKATCEVIAMVMEGEGEEGKEEREEEEEGSKVNRQDLV